MALLAIPGFLSPRCGLAAIVVDKGDGDFYANAQAEITAMRDGQRGVVCASLIRNLDLSSSTTTIRPVTSDEKTWHPNDMKGTRSHVVPADTSPRGGGRNTPTSALIYLHPSRVNPELSLFKLGTFAQLLAVSLDLNKGVYSGDFRLRERRSMFYRNAWRDSFGLSLFQISDGTPTPEYSNAKAHGYIDEIHEPYFPILNIDDIPLPLDTPPMEVPDADMGKGDAIP